MKIEANGQIRWTHITIADNFFKRLVGLTRTKSLKKGEGMLITKCNQIHTFHMKFCIDAIYLSEALIVLRVDTICPRKFGPLVKGARNVLEVAAGSAEQNGISEGTQLNIIYKS